MATCESFPPGQICLREARKLRPVVGIQANSVTQPGLAILPVVPLTTAAEPRGGHRDPAGAHPHPRPAPARLLRHGRAAPRP